VLRLVSHAYMPSPLPRRLNGACSLVSLHPQRPSLCNSQVGSCHYFFEACSAFTHVMACTLAESPCDPLHRRLRQLCCLRCRFDCYRVERTSSRAGLVPPEVQRLFTAHFYDNYAVCPTLQHRLIFLCSFSSGRISPPHLPVLHTVVGPRRSGVSQSPTDIARFYGAK
jgi:hypothetical protein